MKPRRAPMKRTKIERGTSELRRTEFKRKGSGFQSGAENATRFNSQRGSVGDASPDGPTPQRRNGPVKRRSESTNIPKPIKLAAYARDEWRCQNCGLYIPGSGRRWCLQHRDARGMGGSKLRHTLPNLVLMCGWVGDPGTCTQWAEVEQRATATRLGWFVPNGAAPEEWRVWRWTRNGHRWEQPGDIWTPAEPHPRQLESAA